MGAGVSLSLSRDGVHGGSICSSFFSLISDPFPREHGFYVGSVPFSREQVYYVSNLLEGVSLSANLLSPVFALIYVSLTRDYISMCVSILPKKGYEYDINTGFFESSAGALSTRGRHTHGCLCPSRFRGGAIADAVSGVPVGATHSPDLMYTALFGVCEGRPGLPIHDRGLVGLVHTPVRVDFEYAECSDRASSDPLAPVIDGACALRAVSTTTGDDIIAAADQRCLVSGTGKGTLTRKTVGLFACGYSSPDPIVEGTTRKAGGHKSALSDAKSGLFAAGYGSRGPDPVNGEGKGNNSGVVITPMTTNGASGLIVAEFASKSPDPVGCGSGDSPMGSLGTMKDDEVPTSTIFRRSPPAASLLGTELMKGGKGGLNLGYHIDDKASASPTVKRIGALTRLTPVGENFGLCGDEQDPGISSLCRSAFLGQIVNSAQQCSGSSLPDTNLLFQDGSLRIFSMLVPGLPQTGHQQVVN